MRKSLVVGILPESKNIWERRAPLSPKDIDWLIEKTNHHGISDLIRNAVVTQNGKLTSRFKYLNKYL